MEEILMTDEMYISLGFTKTEGSTEHTVYWMFEGQNFTEYWNNSLKSEDYQSLIYNKFKGNMYVAKNYNTYGLHLTIRVYPSAQPYKLVDVIKGMNWHFTADNIEKGKDIIRQGIKELLNIKKSDINEYE